jgi:lysyl-tRNA synthetase class 1
VRRSFPCQLRETTWQDEALQVAVFNAARLTPIDQPSAFKAIYRVLLDRESGPKAGNLLSFLDRDFVLKRLAEVPWDELEFLHTTGMPVGGFERWLISEKAKIVSISARYRSIEEAEGESIVEFMMTMTDGKTHCRRALLGEGKVEETAHVWLRELETASGFSISLTT